MKKTVFLTGATGNMGWQGFQELLKKTDRFQLRILARPSKKNIAKLKPYINNPDVSIIWGDLLDIESIRKGVAGADYVLHVGGMVSPAADYFPEKTLKTNIGAAELIVKAVLEQPDADNIRVVYIGSVAQYGNRMGELLWGRAGDPMLASRYDMYSVSKCTAEKVLIDSGIKHWVSLRQSGILYAGILKVVNPTAFHVPVRGGLEWATIEDSGRLLANVVEDDVPEEFWNRVYNISSGAQYRMTNYEFEDKLLRALGMPGPEKVFRPEWFATQNFHGMWYTDADVLESYLHFRANTPIDEYFASMKKTLPWYYSLAPLAPAWAVKLFMRKFAYEKGMGTQDWVKNNPDKLAAYYGSAEEYAAIRSWAQMRPGYIEKSLSKAASDGEVCTLNHGYDESRDIHSLGTEELEAAAAFRGGRFLGPADASVAGESGAWNPGALFIWECEHSHRFTASLEYVLLAGGWCPECGYVFKGSEDCPQNSFLRQVIR